MNGKESVVHKLSEPIKTEIDIVDPQLNMSVIICGNTVQADQEPAKMKNYAETKAIIKESSDGTR